MDVLTMTHGKDAATRSSMPPVTIVCVPPPLAKLHNGHVHVEQ
jgi:hypothetical protein